MSPPISRARVCATTRWTSGRTVRVHVLGPPRSDDLLYRKDPRKGESYDHTLAARAFQAARLQGAAGLRRGAPSSEERDYPFNQQYKRRGATGSRDLRRVRRAYRAAADAWRTIDDWLQQAIEIDIPV